MPKKRMAVVMSDTVCHFRSPAWRRALVGMTSALALAAPTPSLAQQVFDLDEITVSTNRVPTEIQRSGASVDVLDRAGIEASGAAQVSDVLGRLPGVSVAQSGGAGAQTAIRIRGAAPGYTVVLVDGIRVDDPSGTSVQTDFGHMSLDDIERIEVLRGTQSALYGGSAVGGVINITTRRPDQDGFSQSAFAEAGSHGARAAGYTLGFRDDRLEAALTLAHRRARGVTNWEGIPGTPGFVPDAEADGFESTRASLSLRYNASEALSLGVSGFVQRSRNEYDTSNPITWDMLPDSEAESRWRQAGLRAFAELNTGAVQHEFSVNHYQITRDMIEPGTVNSFEGRRTGLAYQGVATLDAGWTLIWGADTTREEVTAQTLAGGTERARTSGIFGQALWTPGDTLDLGATLRVDRNSGFGNFVTGRLTAAWQAGQGTTLRGAVARGFRPPSLSERFDDYGWFVGNPALQPETSISAEIGVDHRFSNGARVSATAFWLNTDNLIAFDDSVMPNTLSNIPGTSRRRGVELSGEVPVTDRLRLSGGYTYIDARDPQGGRLPRVPRHDLGIGLDADLAQQLRGAINLQHVAGRIPETAGPLEDYTLVNASLRFAATATADIYLRAENLFDRQYQHIPGYATPGRSFHVGVAARF